ncbi:hypothetical protein K2173_008894 [Erythroxylum novogranatense]|uniref:Uncharacterized protein n=1 Tax=Erythroxylum novogranatense TaxID=1862640 RepID=A0AAV8S4V1_9ROSI|nr:hypothetical protein K2173_008894 [Erythroxylum novogranatense]
MDSRKKHPHREQWRSASVRRRSPGWGSRGSELCVSFLMLFTLSFPFSVCLYFNGLVLDADWWRVEDDGVVKREELFITSKLWNSDHAPEDTTLQDLQLDYFDLHFKYPGTYFVIRLLTDPLHLNIAGETL